MATARLSLTAAEFTPTTTYTSIITRIKMVHVRIACWTSVLLLQDFARALVFKHDSTHQKSAEGLVRKVEGPKDDGKYEDLVTDMMKDVAEITAKETLDHVSEELKEGVEKEKSGGEGGEEKSYSNDAANPLKWMGGLFGNVVSRTEDILSNRVLESAQKAFDQQVYRNGDLINPAEEYLHPDPATRRVPQMPKSGWSKNQPTYNIPKEPTGVFAPEAKPAGSPSDSGSFGPGSIDGPELPVPAVSVPPDPSGAGGIPAITIPIVPGFTPWQAPPTFIQTSSGKSEERQMPGSEVKDLLGDVVADLNDIAQSQVVNKVKDGFTKDYDEDVAAKKEALQSAKNPIDWLGKFGAAKKAEVADQIHDRLEENARAKAQKIFDNQVDEDGTPKQGTMIDSITKIFSSPLKRKKKNEETSPPSF